jgi:YHS domain-containing protein
MKVDRRRAVSKQLHGETHYFCSTHCLRAFEAEPDRYTHRGGLAAAFAAIVRLP